MRLAPIRPVLALTGTCLALTLAACGGDDDSGTTPPPQPRPTAQAEDFPKPPAGANMQALVDQYPQGPNLAVSVSILDPGVNRVAFALFDDARKQLSNAAVAVYTARPDGTDVRGPYVARSESLAVKPQFESKTTALDPESTKNVYVADVPLRGTGKRVLLGVAKLDGRMVSTTATTVQVGGYGQGPPKVGEKAPRVHTPTLTSVGGDAAKISTRVPPAEDLLRMDLYDVLGKKPVVLVMATPQLCQTRVCGPTVDIAAQVQASVGEDVAFIHQEIYRENDVSKGFVPQVAAFKLPTEPWTFVIDRTGRVAARFEGALSVGELQRAVARVRA